MGDRQGVRVALHYDDSAGLVQATSRLVQASTGYCGLLQASVCYLEASVCHLQALQKYDFLLFLVMSNVMLSYVVLLFNVTKVIICLSHDVHVLCYSHCVTVIVLVMYVTPCYTSITKPARLD